MYELSVVNERGEALSLTSSLNYTVFKIEGLNPPQAEINSSVNATSDGMKINNVRVPSRNIVIYVAIEGDIEANRINLYKYFPIKRTVTVFFKNGTRNVKIDGVVELIECDLFSQRQVAQISLICAQPYFKSVDELISNFSEVTSLFTFPFSIASAGIAFSEINSNVRKSIVNAGDVPTGIIIELFAVNSVVNPVLYDVFKQTHIQLNFTMQASDRIIINTNTGEKSVTLVRAGISSNALGYLSPDSDWLTLESGDNVFTYSADSGSSNLQITFTTSVLYGGV